jgi:hypothetical protein
MWFDIDEDTLSPLASGRQKQFAQPGRGGPLRVVIGNHRVRTATICYGLTGDRRQIGALAFLNTNSAPKLHNPPVLVYDDGKILICQSSIVFPGGRKPLKVPARYTKLTR